MLETAIVGGGLCGMTLARSLQQSGGTFALFEARHRLGGRVLSARSKAGLALDLGPTWFWPETQPQLTGLIAELGLSHFAQHDDGTVLHLKEADKAAEPISGPPIHQGARRLSGGMTRLIEALARELPSSVIHLGHELMRIVDCGTHVRLIFATETESVAIEAKRAVLALPPRLLIDHVGFFPALDDATFEAMRNAETWMAAQAKVVIAYDQAHWRDKGQSGNAFVSHEQAVVGEIFDACDEGGDRAALGGFLAFPPDLREAFNVGLPMLMDSQMVQLFGAALDGGEQHYQDWATERFTCSALDRATPRGEHSEIANPMLRRALWDGRLHLGGAETASHAAGYLEGAVNAARRIERALTRVATETSIGRAAAIGEGLSGNAASLAWFASWVAAQRDAAFDDYRQRLNRSLATQQREQLTQLAVLGAMEQVFAAALQVLDALTFDMRDVTVERGRSALMPEIQKPFRDVMQSLLDDAVAFNRTSCALSNFPFEHKPSKDYVQAILRDIAAAWQEFSLAANRLLLAKSEAVRQPTGVSS
ncbi:putative amine oxidase [Bradyrhizobium sp. ORS 375]|uniref:flavin monoamine oxidase family protein n=1 Tax=Bradyrhizobium sp. (strain ORS 375) TaxID=566679 RepID=UPI0002408668|nr:FAD-dependent oxidoreductase [Bradyrhizobium sp. ORS 375]CCD96897.1 putative amine oxidase [Bradyrhizobium sp. ORS 375]